LEEESIPSLAAAGAAKFYPSVLESSSAPQQKRDSLDGRHTNARQGGVRRFLGKAWNPEVNPRVSESVGGSGSERSDAELAKLRAETRAAKLAPVFDAVKTFAAAAAAAAAVVLFVAIQRPDSLLSRRATEESISRERAKLLINALDDTLPTRRKLKFDLIMASYGTTDTIWTTTVGRALNSFAESAVVAQGLNDLARFVRGRDSLNVLIKNELSSTGRPGAGPAFALLQRQFVLNEEVIRSLIARLREAGVDTTRIQALMRPPN
jgi:hypothetical protein